MKKIIIVTSIFITFTIVKNIESKTLGQYTGLEIPRFVSTKANELNLRVGAGTTYPIIIRYTEKNIPLKIIGEHKNWRKVEDFDGNMGWVLKSLIKGNRYALINPPYKEPAQIYNKPKGKIIGKIGKKNIVKLNRCLINWCLVSLNKHNGWVNKSNLWGILPKEIYKKPFYQPIINFTWELF